MKIKIKDNIILVSDKDFKKIKTFKWYINKMGYVANDSKPRKLMHRFIMDFPKSNIDHKNGNKLDNRRSNLRLCNQSENTANATKRKTNTSGYKGVSWDKKAKKWSVFTTKNYKHIFGGYFDDIELAAKRYKELAHQVHGKFTKI